MAQIYKIYMNESVLFVTDFNEKIPGTLQAIDSQYFDIRKLFQDIVENGINSAFLLRVKHPEACFKQIKASVKVIRAAGGLVKNANAEYLFIERLGKWDLPKGKVEPNEKMAETAVREVEEECGVTVDKLGEKIRSTYHVYILRGDFIIKKTNWYHMSVAGVPDLIPQKEEDIQQALWVKPEDFASLLSNTYPLIKEMVLDLFPHVTLTDQ